MFNRVLRALICCFVVEYKVVMLLTAVNKKKSPVKVGVVCAMIHMTEQQFGSSTDNSSEIVPMQKCALS